MSIPILVHDSSIAAWAREVRRLCEVLGRFEHPSGVSLAHVLNPALEQAAASARSAKQKPPDTKNLPPYVWQASCSRARREAASPEVAMASLLEHLEGELRTKIENARAELQKLERALPSSPTRVAVERPS
jgi:hypothetical protein